MVKPKPTIWILQCNLGPDRMQQNPDETECRERISGLKLGCKKAVAFMFIGIFLRQNAPELIFFKLNQSTNGETTILCKFTFRNTSLVFY